MQEGRIDLLAEIIMNVVVFIPLGFFLLDAHLEV